MFSFADAFVKDSWDSGTLGTYWTGRTTFLLTQRLSDKITIQHNSYI